METEFVTVLWEEDGMRNNILIEEVDQENCKHPDRCVHYRIEDYDLAQHYHIEIFDQILIAIPSQDNTLTVFDLRNNSCLLVDLTTREQQILPSVPFTYARIFEAVTDFLNDDTHP